MSATLTPAPAEARPRTFWTSQEVEVAAELDCHERGRRYQKNVGLGTRRAYDHLRKRMAIGGDGTTNSTQLATDLYPDVAEAFEEYQTAKRATDKETAEAKKERWLKLARDKRQTVRARMQLMARQGLIQYDEHKSAGGAGKCYGWAYELLPVPEKVARMAAARGCSSVGSRYSVAPQEGRRRRRKAAQKPPRRGRRWCPPAARGTPHEPPPKPRRVFFAPASFDPLERPGVTGPLKGPSDPGTQLSSTCARVGPTRDATPASSLSDPQRRVLRHWRWRGAPPAWLTAERAEHLLPLWQLEGSEDGGFESLVALAHDGLDGFVVCLGAWALAGWTNPMLGKPMAGKLEEGLQLADQWGRFGEGLVGAGAEKVCWWIEHDAEQWRDGEAAPPWGLGFYAVQLLATAKRWRRSAKGLPPLPVRESQLRRRARFEAEREEAAARLASGRRMAEWHRRRPLRRDELAAERAANADERRSFAAVERLYAAGAVDVEPDPGEVRAVLGRELAAEHDGQLHLLPEDETRLRMGPSEGPC